MVGSLESKNEISEEIRGGNHSFVAGLDGLFHQDYPFLKKKTKNEKKANSLAAKIIIDNILYLMPTLHTHSHKAFQNTY